MDNKQPKRRTPAVLIIDEASPVNDLLYSDPEATKGAPLTLPHGSFKKWSPTVDIKPGEMWPDGKVRPHMIKTVAGEKLWLTAEEYDQLVLEARHRQYANPMPASSRPRPKLDLGARIYPEYPEDSSKDGFPYLAVRKIKADGRVILETLNDDLGDLVAGCCMRIAGDDFVVLRASGRSVTIRLRPTP